MMWPFKGFFKRALVEAGYQVDTASNAKTGELKALEGIHDAFIIDLGLPDMDGLDLIATVPRPRYFRSGVDPVRTPFRGRASKGIGAGRR